MATLIKILSQDHQFTILYGQYECSYQDRYSQENSQKQLYFNNILLASQLRIIKVSPKSDMTIIWLDIWGSQSGMNARDLINKYFNISSFIATIKEQI